MLAHLKMPKTTFDLATETIAWLKAWNVTVLFNRSTYHLWIISMEVGIERMASDCEICMTQDIAWKEYLSKKTKCDYDNEICLCQDMKWKGETCERKHQHMDSSHSGGDPAPGLLSCPTQLIYIQRKKYFTILIFITNIISIKVTKVQLLAAMVRTLRSPPAPWRELFETLENNCPWLFRGPLSSKCLLN